VRTSPCGLRPLARGRKALSDPVWQAMATLWSHRCKTLCNCPKTRGSLPRGILPSRFLPHGCASAEVCSEASNRESLISVGSVEVGRHEAEQAGSVVAGAPEVFLQLSV
jgi:hypothetical protein